MPLFDSSMSALPILRSHPGARVSLFTYQQGTWAGFRPSRDRLVLSYCWLYILYNSIDTNLYIYPSCIYIIYYTYILCYHRGSNWGSSTRGTALTRYVYIECYDSGNNSDSNACRSYMDYSTSEPLLRWNPVLSLDETYTVYIILYTIQL